jgi:hypothetical protein
VALGLSAAWSGAPRNPAESAVDQEEQTGGPVAQLIQRTRERPGDRPLLFCADDLHAPDCQHIGGKYQHPRVVQA